MDELPLAWDWKDFQTLYGEQFRTRVGREAVPEDVEQRDEQGQLVWSCLLSTLLNELAGQGKMKALRGRHRTARLFYRICYNPGEIILRKGVQSDFAGILLRGRFHVDDHTEESLAEPEGRDCWSQAGPWERSDAWYLAWYRAGLSLLRSVLRRPAPKKMLSEPIRYGAPAAIRSYLAPPTGIRDDSGQLRRLTERLTGVTSTIWNQPRNVTLVADVDPEDEVPESDARRLFEPQAYDERGRPLCEMLLIRRTALVEILGHLPQLYENKVQKFLSIALPRQLADNRLYRDSLVSSDVADQDWQRFVQILQGRHPQSSSPAAQRIRQCLEEDDEDFVHWLSGLDEGRLQTEDRYRVSGALRSLLSSPQLYSSSSWPREDLDEHTAELIERRSQLKEYELVRLNRMLIESALDGTVQSSDRELAESLYTADVAESDWPVLITRFQGRDGGSDSSAIQLVRQLCDASFLEWVDGLSAEDHELTDRFRIMQQLRAAMIRQDLVRRDLLAGLPACLSMPRLRPLCETDFRELAWLFHFHGGDDRDSLSALRFEAGDVVYDQQQDAEALYLVITGMLRVSRQTPNGEMLINHIERNGYVGESCILEPQVKHGSRVTAQTLTTLLKIRRDVVRKVASEFPGIERLMQRERERMHHRDQTLHSAYRRPPPSPPQPIASRLMVATDILRIDMDLCTRCDQCVQACTAAHGDRPRFHRGNPSLRFGKWEIAGACVHCKDAPCQQVCPVSAISFLPDESVHIHRDRCIGCKDCVEACPFDVIEMHPPAFEGEGAARGAGQPLATKCDLCLTDSRDPPCVIACPYGAAERGAPDAFFEEIRGWAAYSDEM